MTNRRAPVPTLERLATYLTFLTELNAHGVDMISSSDIEARTGINAAQFRKDLSYFGEFGRPGIGYNIQDLVKRVARILKVEREQRVLLVGAGNLGSAIAGYPGLRAQNFHIVAVFDNNFSKIGRQLWDLQIYDTAELKSRNDDLGAKLAIIAVPASVAQNVADLLVEANVKAILNFAPLTLKLPQGVVARNVDFVQELAVLSFHISRDEVDVDSTATDEIERSV